MIISRLETSFGKMTAVRGDNHVFLGMNITYNQEAQTATIGMCDYLTKAIAESGLAITKTASSLANKDPFTISAASISLTKVDTKIFHSDVANCYTSRSALAWICF